MRMVRSTLLCCLWFTTVICSLLQPLKLEIIQPVTYHKLERLFYRIEQIGIDGETFRIWTLSGYHNIANEQSNFKYLTTKFVDSFERVLALRGLATRNISLNSLKIQACIIDKIKTQELINTAVELDYLAVTNDIKINNTKYVIKVIFDNIAKNYLGYYLWRLEWLTQRNSQVTQQELYYIYTRVETMVSLVKDKLNQLYSLPLTKFMESVLIPMDGLNCNMSQVVDCLKKRRKKEECRDSKDHKCLESLFHLTFVTLIIPIPLVVLYRVCSVSAGYVCVEGIGVLGLLITKSLTSQFFYLLFTRVKHDCLKWLFEVERL
ncbi:hypothetical protein J7293_00911 [Nakaseomyces glabratus]|nr:hypothetical protein J7293_00911 [Nakaseomyces glabratus]KAH7608511.1 hypothetical protein J7294_00910 [Nakaseomyces glabratus]